MSNNYYIFNHMQLYNNVYAKRQQTNWVLYHNRLRLFVITRLSLYIISKLIRLVNINSSSIIIVRHIVAQYTLESVDSDSLSQRYPLFLYYYYYYSLEQYQPCNPFFTVFEIKCHWVQFEVWLDLRLYQVRSTTTTGIHYDLRLRSIRIKHFPLVERLRFARRDLLFFFIWSQFTRSQRAQNCLLP